MFESKKFVTITRKRNIRKLFANNFPLLEDNSVRKDWLGSENIDIDEIDLLQLVCFCYPSTIIYLNDE